MISLELHFRYQVKEWVDIGRFNLSSLIMFFHLWHLWHHPRWKLFITEVAFISVGAIVEKKSIWLFAVQDFVIYNW